MYVIDLRHWLDEQGRLDAKARLGPFVVALVESATATSECGVSVNRCRKSTTRTKCSGSIATWLRDDVIEWTCNTCPEAGVISGWQGTEWDLRDVEPTSAPTDVLVFMPLAELPALRRLPMPAPARAIMAAPPPITAGVVGLPLTAAEATWLLKQMRIRVDGMKGAQLAALERSVGRVEQALMFAEQVNATEQRRRQGDRVH